MMPESEEICVGAKSKIHKQMANHLIRVFQQTRENNNGSAITLSAI